MLRWTVVNVKGGRKMHHVAVAVQHTLYSFGGWAFGGWQMAVHVFNTVSLDWMMLDDVPPVTTGTGRGERPPEVPSRRRGHTAVLVGDVIYIWGGDQQAKCNRLYAFDVNSHRWLKTDVSGAVPEGRYGHSACVLGKFMYVFGGISPQTHMRTNDVYKLDTASMVWSSINAGGVPPTASYSHSATIIGTKMFVFRGLPSDTLYTHIRVFDTETNCWLKNKNKGIYPGDGHRCHSAFTYNGGLYIFGGRKTERKLYYIFGGRDTEKNFSDLWKFTPETFSWKQVWPTEKSPFEWRAGMCCCTVGDRIVLYGGCKNNPTINTSCDDLYMLDMSPSLKTLCKLAVIQYRLMQSGLPHNVRWELATDDNRQNGSIRGNKRKRKY